MMFLGYLLAALPAVGQWGGDRSTAYEHVLEVDVAAPMKAPVDKMDKKASKKAKKGPSG